MKYLIFSSALVLVVGLIMISLTKPQGAGIRPPKPKVGPPPPGPPIVPKNITARIPSIKS